MTGNLAQTQQRQRPPKVYVYIADNCILCTSVYVNRKLEAYIASPPYVGPLIASAIADGQTRLLPTLAYTLKNAVHVGSQNVE